MTLVNAILAGADSIDDTDILRSGSTWAVAAGPGKGRLAIDVDSFVGEVCGRLKQGAAYGYTRVLGYHPLLASSSDTGEVLHVRNRKGSANTQRGVLRFAHRRPQGRCARPLPLRRLQRQLGLVRDRLPRPHLARWSALIGLPDQPRRAGRTFRQRHLRMPGRLTRTARQRTLHLPQAVALAASIRRGAREDQGDPALA